MGLSKFLFLSKCVPLDPLLPFRYLNVIEDPLVGCSQLGGDQPHSVIVSIFSTHLALFGISPKLPNTFLGL
ncbi:hypothetical protein HETIRDRAFT_307606 [Heterobasidion irregulare TC 32-1]|uniref:Uncharacterized protein n=1 Tax=Heterobasidion irregulare (strain TC 32-1) TaxID=747525 RepID=W4KKX4_HETIT|nr:uncharacterized protein HETIRDRAFT_307606 [Heterobasidion irregulare TC 32-1]ETW86503.1 hypothetical protein HETIRDRAFT_307606 [Heterobasidion irregulare TC 32-1]